MKPRRPLPAARLLNYDVSIPVFDPLLRPFHARSTARTVCVFDVDRQAGKLILTELQPGVTVEDVKKATGAKFELAKEVVQLKE